MNVDLNWRGQVELSLSTCGCSLASSCHKRAQEAQKESLSISCLLGFLWLRSNPVEGMDVARISPVDARFFKHRTRLNPVILLFSVKQPDNTETSGWANQMNIDVELNRV